MRIPIKQEGFRWECHRFFGTLLNSSSEKHLECQTGSVCWFVAGVPLPWSKNVLYLEATPRSHVVQYLVTPMYKPWKGHLGRRSNPRNCGPTINIGANYSYQVGWSSKVFVKQPRWWRLWYLISGVMKWDPFWRMIKQWISHRTSAFFGMVNKNDPSFL